MTSIKLQSCDGEIIIVDVQVAKCSGTISTMIECLGMEDDDDGEVVLLPNVTANMLKKVIEWATYHKDDPKPPIEDEIIPKRTDDIPPWDLKFLDVDHGTLFELINAANYLDVKGLLDVSCKKVANILDNKTIEQIRETFNITNDFTPDEENRIIKENSWYEP